MIEQRCDSEIRFRAPASIREALREASARQMTSVSEFARRALLAALKADGAHPTDDREAA